MLTFNVILTYVQKYFYLYVHSNAGCLYKSNHVSIIMRRWCGGNMKPFQGLASGSIPERRTLFSRSN
jgi:hypothetical protein